MICVFGFPPGLDSLNIFFGGRGGGHLPRQAPANRSLPESPPPTQEHDRPVEGRHPRQQMLQSVPGEHVAGSAVNLLVEGLGNFG